jgi:hypothetical protein
MKRTRSKKSRDTVPLKNLLAAWATLLIAVIVTIDVPVTPLVALNAEVIPAQKTLKKNSKQGFQME